MFYFFDTPLAFKIPFLENIFPYISKRLLENPLIISHLSAFSSSADPPPSPFPETHLRWICLSDRLFYFPQPSGSLWLLPSSLLACLSWNNRFVDMNILPIAPNTIAKRISEPNRKERSPTASISDLPNPFVPFVLVGILPAFRADVEMWPCNLLSYNPAERGNHGSDLRKNKGNN